MAPNILSRSIRTGQPPEPVPCLLLDQLTTDLSWAGRDIGTGLFRHALQTVRDGGEACWWASVKVNAVNDEAAEFWRRRGFIPSKDEPLVPFRSIADIAASSTTALR